MEKIGNRIKASHFRKTLTNGYRADSTFYKWYIGSATSRSFRAMRTCQVIRGASRAPDGLSCPDVPGQAGGVRSQ